MTTGSGRCNILILQHVLEILRHSDPVQVEFGEEACKAAELELGQARTSYSTYILVTQGFRYLFAVRD